MNLGVLECRASMHLDFIQLLLARLRMSAEMLRDTSTAPGDDCTMKARPIRVGMLTYSFYENDGRVKRYAETLASRGYHVDVISLKKTGQPTFASIKGVAIHRIQERIGDERGRLSYFLRILRFFFHSAFFVSRLHFQRPYDLIHVHSLPDFEIFAAFLPKLFGSKLILDIHDIVPELYVSKFGAKSSGLLFKTLVKMEHRACAFAHHVIIANHIWEEKLLARSVALNKCTTILNYPDTAIFYPRKRTRIDDKFIMIYPGTLNWHQGLDVAINAFATIANQYPQAELHIYGRGSELNHLKDLAKMRKLEHCVLFQPLVPIEEIAESMNKADLGIIPKRDDPFGGEAFSTKSLEFMSVGLPVVMSRTKIDSHYFNESVVRFFEPDDVESLAAAMSEMIDNEAMRKKLSENASKFVKDFSWERKQQVYLDIVDRLVRPS